MGKLNCPHECPDVVWIQVLPCSRPRCFRSFCRICCLSALNVDELSRELVAFHLDTCPGVQRELVYNALVNLRRADVEHVTEADIRAAQVISETRAWVEVDVELADGEN